MGTKSFRIRADERRQRLFENTKETTGENTNASAIETACKYYLRMKGETIAHPTGQIEELMTVADERGNLTPEEIAEILDCKELPIEVHREIRIGDEDG